MGFVPIFLTLAGFVLLFIMVVSHSIKSKKEQYKTTMATLLKLLGMESTEPFPTDELIGQQLTRLSSESSASDSPSRLFGKAKLLKHQYNQLIETMPYKIVAKITGHHSI